MMLAAPVSCPSWYWWERWQERYYHPRQRAITTFIAADDGRLTAALRTSYDGYLYPARSRWEIKSKDGSPAQHNKQHLVRCDGASVHVQHVLDGGIVSMGFILYLWMDACLRADHNCDWFVYGWIIACGILKSWIGKCLTNHSNRWRKNWDQCFFSVRRFLWYVNLNNGDNVRSLRILIFWLIG